MKKLAILIAACVAGTAAHAESAKKGAIATLHVEYMFTSTGGFMPASKDNKRKWHIERVVSVTANYAADAPQPYGVMHAKDAPQQQAIKEQKAKVEALSGQMQPMMGDMMKIAAECNDDEKCIEAKVNAYANAMGKPTDVKQKQAAISDLTNQGPPAYQLWRSTGQSGSYKIREDSTLEVFDLTCPGDKYCKRTVTTKGNGPIPDPPGGRSVAGASMFEVDNWQGNIILQLPVALQPLPTETSVVSNIAHDEVKSGKGFAKPMLVNVEPIKVPFKGGHIQASGSKTIPIPGKFEEGGTLTITWTLTAQ